jgi:phosphatidylserine decarboxylase
MSALTFATAQILRVVPRARVGQALGWLADLQWSPIIGRAVVGLYSRAYGVALGECKSDVWRSFDAFFTRGLRDGARPVDQDPRGYVSAADGCLASMGQVDGKSTWLVKGRPYRVDELLGSHEEARRYEGGLACVIYLSPRDYHRVHSPVRGIVRHVRSIAGDYYPVNSIGVRHVPNLFVRNRRVAIAIDASLDSGLGTVTLVMVSAMIVGRITVTGIAARDVPFGDHLLNVPVEKGGEIGVFHLGSTAVVLFPKEASAEWTASEGPVRLGERIAVSTRVPSLPEREYPAHPRDFSRPRGVG